MELFEYLNAVRRRWYVPVALVVLTVVVVLVVTDPNPPPRATASDVEYTATVTMVADGSQSGGGANLARTAFLVKVGEIPQRAADILGYEDEPLLLTRTLTANANPDLGTLSIAAKDTDPDEAVALAEAFAAATTEFFADRAHDNFESRVEQVNTRLEATRQQIADLDAQLRDTAEGSTNRSILQAQRDSAVNQYRLAYEAFQQLATSGPGGSGLEILQHAVAIPGDSTDVGFKAPQSRTARLLAGSGIALGLGIVLALVIDRLDTRLRTRADFEDAYGAPVLAEIPSVAKRRRREFLPALQSDRRLSVHREAHRSLRTQLQLRINEHAASGERRTVIVVTSALPREGKTTTVASLAASFAETGRSVLVLSADFRRPSIHRHFGVANTGPGLSDVLNGSVPLAECVVDTAVEGVTLVPSGTALSQPQNLLDHGADLLDAARQLADIVVIDTAPVLLSSDTAEIVVRADHVVVVGRAGRTGRNAAIRSADLLASLTEIAGIVIVGAAVEGGLRYAYYYGDAAAAAPAAAKPTNGHMPSPEPVAAGRVAAQRSGPRHTATRPVSSSSGPLYRRIPGCFVVAGLDGAIGHVSGSIRDIPLSDDALFVWEALTVPVNVETIAAALSRVTGVDTDATEARTQAAIDDLVRVGLVDRVP